MLDIQWEDAHVIVVYKPAGIEAQSSRGFSPDMVSELKRYIHSLSPDKGEPYVGVVHRLDQPVSGLMVYAKTKQAAAELSRQVSESSMTKKYQAVLCGKAVDKVDKYVDYLLKDGKTNTSRIVDKGITGAKCAQLWFQSLQTIETIEYGWLTLDEIELITGRHHQIRVQMAARGWPVWGDHKYNPAFQAGKGKGMIALAACELTFLHPQTRKVMIFKYAPRGAGFEYFKVAESPL